MKVKDQPSLTPATSAAKPSYEGDMLRERKHGLGTLRYPDGKIEKGEWNLDRKHGNFATTYPDGKKEKGTWNLDRKHGNFETTYPWKNKKRNLEPR